MVKKDVARLTEYSFNNVVFHFFSPSGCSFTTPNDRCYKFMFPRLIDGTTKIEFSVNTSADAFIALTTENRYTDPLYEIGRLLCSVISGSVMGEHGGMCPKPINIFLPLSHPSKKKKKANLHDLPGKVAITCRKLPRS